MKIAGIVAEYNPFHTGHAYQIACTRAQLGEDCAIVAVMSGHWVQGGRPAIADKWTRTRLALLGGADLVRVHDVKENVRAIRMTKAILNK